MYVAEIRRVILRIIFGETGGAADKTPGPIYPKNACGMLVRVRGGVIQNVMGVRCHHVSRGKLCGKCAIASCPMKMWSPASAG